MASFLIKHAAFFIAFILFFIPFFWMKPGEMDLGGDGGRLFFYDPTNFLKHSISYVFPYGVGKVEASFFNLPFTFFMMLFKHIIPSGYLLISIFNGIKIAGGFLAVYAITKELILINKSGGKLKNASQTASVIAGLFYVFSHSMRDNYVLALPTQDQVLLNPLIFYLILKYLTTSNFGFMWIALFISFIFSHSFSYGAAPSFFAFYPLSIVFLLLYVSFIRRIKIPWRGLLVALVFFIGIHGFHVIPELSDLLTPGSHINERVFSKNETANLIGYFYGVLSIPKVSYYLLSYAVSNQLHFASVIIPLVVILGFIVNHKREKTILLLGLFFLIVLFLISAKITNIGIEFYKLLFYIPGYSMFRNFYGQWQFVFYFFYALLFGQALFIVLSSIKRKVFIITIPILLTAYLLFSSWNFINGKVVNQENALSSGKKFPIVMDPHYENVLKFFHSTVEDGKILLFPFSDNYFQLVHGANNGVYIGRSLIGQLTGQKDFSGYTDIAPYSEIFIHSAQERNYDQLKEILGVLNIRFILHNTDSKIYDNAFLGAPYSYVRKFFPVSQKEYSEFLKPLVEEKAFESGPFRVYKTSSNVYLPHFYIPTEIVVYENDPKTDMIFAAASSFIVKDNPHDPRVVFIDKNNCIHQKALNDICKDIAFGSVPQLYFKKISPVKYSLRVTNIKSPFVLVLSDSYHRNWKVFLDPKGKEKSQKVKSYFKGDIKEGPRANIYFDKDILETVQLSRIPEEKHFLVNAYANAWYITPRSTRGNTEETFVVEMVGNRIFYASALFTLLTLVGFFIYGVILFLPTGLDFYRRYVHRDKP